MMKAPWLKFYNSVPHHLDYPDISIFELMEKAAEKYPDHIAYEFFGTTATYTQFVEEVHQCAKALKSLGIKEEDRVTICLPNVPQAIIMFYAINMIGAIANMVHPLAAEGEIRFFLKDSNSVAAITLDAFYEKFSNVIKDTNVKYLIITSIKDKLNPLKTLGYFVTKGRKIKPIPRNADLIYWKDFLEIGERYGFDYIVRRKGNDPAVILYSGGTTGTTKGILLTNLNFNALALQTIAMGDCASPGDSMLSIMPIFHGFGLGIGIHTMLVHGCKCILIPAFSAQTFGTLLKKNQPNHIAGVPTLYEALLRSKKIKKNDLKCLKGVFCGGDSLSVELKKKVDAFLKEHGATVQIREGYGTTECVTASCLTPKNYYREGSIGLPFPDTYYKIVKPNTQEEVPYGTEGEICIHGPTVMLGYIGNPKETAHALQIHPDGLTWLHTGDLGVMDEDGFVYFVQRLKRVIISSGYSIYPSQLENIIDAHEAVLMSTVIGVDDPYKIQKVKAFIVLKPNISPTEEVRESIRKHCEKNIAKYAMPYEFEFRESLPKTLVGKVAYTILEAEEREKEERRRNNRE
ncbi:MAG TPA: AMP-dependent synthetase [Clostridiales bacterium UBA9856]|jgi:long-chain acyl-CoA synthetase|nr:AMP-dependent synthetase [Clostridiales bacterium UBA9856]HOA42786.1 AMP-binding protein [Bacillota bacterium]HPZ59676.1 AMP-binding protein [Bacillota bacterium]